jgi:hypothetical protein
MWRRFLISVTISSVLLAAPVVWAQPLTLPPVVVVLTLDIRDQAAWLNLEHEVLATTPDAQKRLIVTIPTRAGSGRAIVLLAPKFSATFSGKVGAATIRVKVKGEVAGAHAPHTLLPFMEALLESPAELGTYRVTMEYGLTTLSADLLEMKLEDR